MQISPIVFHLLQFLDGGGVRVDVPAAGLELLLQLLELGLQAGQLVGLFLYRLPAVQAGCVLITTSILH